MANKQTIIVNYIDEKHPDCVWIYDHELKRAYVHAIWIEDADNNNKRTYIQYERPRSFFKASSLDDFISNPLIGDSNSIKQYGSMDDFEAEFFVSHI